MRDQERKQILFRDCRDPSNLLLSGFCLLSGYNDIPGPLDTGYRNKTDKSFCAFCFM